MDFEGEQMFKVGDWVRIKTPIFEYDGTDRIAEGIKKLSIKDMWIFDENHFKMNPDRYIVHWKPKEGEWCWSKKRNKLTNNVCELIRFYWDNVNIGDCEPFIGELPTFAQDMKTYKTIIRKKDKA